VIDLAAGTCWATARISKVPEVNEVVALDMSERFLTTVADRIITELAGNREKIRFAVSSFNDIPLESDYFDCAFMIAAIHHSVTPLRTLTEVLRVLKPNGSLLVIEAPSSVIGIRKARQKGHQITTESGATEIAYTRGELEYMLVHSFFKSRRCLSISSRAIDGSRALSALLEIPSDASSSALTQRPSRMSSSFSFTPCSWLHFAQEGACHFSRFAGVESGYQDFGKTWSDDCSSA
jgi:SAM-dependent methyltransferase